MDNTLLIVILVFVAFKMLNKSSSCGCIKESFKNKNLLKLFNHHVMFAVYFTYEK